MAGLGSGRKRRGLRPNAEGCIIATALVVIALGIVQAFAGATVTGITTDEPTHVSRTQAWLSDGWYVPEQTLVDGEPTATPYVYGPAFSASAHAMNVAVGNEPGDEVSSSKGAWTLRHLLVALIGIAASAAVGLAVWVLTASRTFALWSAAALLATPIWLGMSFFNPKDVPAAAGYTFFTVGLLVALGRETGESTSVRRGVAISALVAVGFYLGAGTRLALWAPLVASLVTYGLLAWARQRFADPPRNPVGTRAIVIGFGVGVAAVALSYPSAVADPIDYLLKSLTDSSNYDPFVGFTLTAGRLASENPPWWYLPTWGFASSPVLILLLGTFAAGTAIWSIVVEVARGGRARLQAIAERRDLPVILVLQQALLLSVGAIVAGSSMYTGLRQHLYVIPALAILAGLGAQRIWERSDSHRDPKWRRGAVAALLSAALIIPMAEQTVLFPYNYTYVNPVAGIGGINDRWETDFWWASSRDALSRMPGDVDPYCSGELIPRLEPGTDPDLYPCAFSSVFAPYLGEREASAGSDGDEAWVLGRKRAGNSVPEYCREEATVTRWLRGEDVVMSYVLRCDRASIAAVAGEELPVLAE